MKEIYLPPISCDALDLSYYNEKVEKDVFSGSELKKALLEKYFEISSREIYNFLKDEAKYEIISKNPQSYGWFYVKQL